MGFKLAMKMFFDIGILVFPHAYSNLGLLKHPEHGFCQEITLLTDNF